MLLARHMVKGEKLMEKTVFNQVDISSYIDEVVKWRRHLHKYPELSYKEKQTSQFVYKTLSNFNNLEVTRPTETSVMATLTGGLPGKTIAFRADMDALPIEEETGLSFASQNKGVMHACGHDGHTAMLLGAAKFLSHIQQDIPGKIIFLFQHAEEQFPGGAKELVEAGVLHGVSEIVGMHLFSPIPTGTISIKSGIFTANSDIFDLHIIGKGGHSSEPQETIDPIAIGAQVVNNLQHIISRKIDPAERAVVSITEFKGGTAKNIIPETVQIGGSVRTFSKGVREKIALQIEKIASGVVKAHGASYDYHYQYGYDSVYNDPDMTLKIKQLVQETFGFSSILEAPPIMGGEDFSAYLQKVPGCFIGIGAGHPDYKENFPHHHPKFNIDENALEVGVKLWIRMPFCLQNSLGFKSKEE